MINSIASLNSLNIEAIAQAIEADAGHAIEGLRKSLHEVKTKQFAAVHTPEQIAARKRGQLRWRYYARCPRSSG